MAGGRDLFLLVTAVDVVMGPVLTFAVFDRSKGWAHLRWDLAVIASLQLAALGYGLHAVHVARPVAIVFEVDRFRVVTAADVHLAELPEAPAPYRRLPHTGPWLLSTREPKDKEERAEALFMALRGVDISQRPKFWRDYEAGRSLALERARPLTRLLERYPERSAEIQKVVSAVGLDVRSARFLPAVARGDWVAVLDATGKIVEYLQIDGFI